VLATDARGRSIVSKFEACTTLGTSMEDSIELKSTSGDRMVIFKYVPDGGIVGCKGKTFPATVEPSVDWSNPSLIHISIPVVSSIVEEHDTVDGMRVTYEIGSVLAEICDFAKE
jgi:hypothetical protein